MKTEQEVRNIYNASDWGKLLISYGYDPYNTESAARNVAKKAAEQIRILQDEIENLNDTIDQCQEDKY